MSAISALHLDNDNRNGGLRPGVLPGVNGWYWVLREGYTAPEVVHVVAPNARTVATGKVYSIGGEYPLIGSTYDHAKTKWFGPFEYPAAWDRDHR